MATEEDNQQPVQTDQTQTQQSDKLGNEAEALGRKQDQKDGENQTAKNVLAAVVGIAVVGLIVWLAMQMM